MSNDRHEEDETLNFRRFIEESFPVKEVGEASAREKSIRHGHISTLHAWWARRPLAASRATAYAALTPAPKDAEEWQKKRDFIIQLSKWENSNNPSLLERARREILEANGGVPPKVLDPFTGGGSYPLEALRLGCESYANDYNPVAVLIEKATLEYPQKFGRPFEGMPDWAKPVHAKTTTAKGKRKKKPDEQPALFSSTFESESMGFNPLLNAVRYWGGWVLEEARRELDKFYPPDASGSNPIGYLWARTIPCQNPACGQEIPLMRQYWLAKKDKKKVALYPHIKGGKLVFRVVGDRYEKWIDEFDPDIGTISQAIVTCPLCGTVIDDQTTRRLFQEHKAGQRLIAVILHNKSLKSKQYRIATAADEITYNNAIISLNNAIRRFRNVWGVEPVPDEALSKSRPSPNARGVSGITRYAFDEWGMLFNQRQLLSLVIFADAIRRAYDVMLREDVSVEFVSAVIAYLGLNHSRLAAYLSSFGYWHVTGEKLSPAMQRQALAMVYDYAEAIPFAESFSWETNLTWILRVIEHCSQIQSLRAPVLSNTSATQLPYPDNFFDVILTDPPYYDNVPYSHLSDYYYVWLKRSIGLAFPELFSTPLSPKANEIVAYTLPDGGFEAGKRFFEANLQVAFKEIRRALKSDGLAVIVYAHKSTEGWESLINSLLDSDLVITGAWPLNTEMQTRLVASESAALASSIYIVARKMPRKPTGFYNDVRMELTQHLDAKLHRLWEEGIGGGDFFIAAIGSAIEVFGKYEKVMDYEGNIVRADRLLEEVRSIATNYAVKQILHNGFASEITPMTRFYVLWRWNYGEALVPFDEANKLAHSCGLDLSLQFSKNGFIKKEKEFVRMLGPQGRKLDDLDDPRDMIDVLHKALLLWEQGHRLEMVNALADRGFGKSEAFYRVAQAISETLPLESKEKKLLDGFLAGRERVQEEVEKAESQGKLF
jgi:adenine-specific DNA methylase